MDDKFPGTILYNQLWHRFKTSENSVQKDLIPTSLRAIAWKTPRLFSHCGLKYPKTMWVNSPYRIWISKWNWPYSICYFLICANLKQMDWLYYAVGWSDIALFAIFESFTSRNNRQKEDSKFNIFKFILGAPKWANWFFDRVEGKKIVNFLFIFSY